MNQPMTGTVLGKMIIEACGIPEERCRRVEIVCEAGHLAIVNVEFIVDISAADGIVTAIKKFKVEEV